MKSLCYVRVAILVLFLAGGKSVEAQQRNVSFTGYFENDTFHKSDTSYTNGLRMAWTMNQYNWWMRKIVDYNMLTGVDKLLSVVQLDRLRLDAVGAIPDSIQSKMASGCTRTSDRNDRKFGACTMLNVGLSQLTYTPDSLASSIVNPSDQPYAGFLFLQLGVTTLDSPWGRDTTHWIGFTEVSHQLLFGVTGKLSGAEDTQALAHWTLSTGARRPLGWNTQLRSAVQAGVISDMWVRPKSLEHCEGDFGCDGTESERRVFDATLHSEAVVSTHMVRFSEGLLFRLGARFPDPVGTVRIPVGAPPGGASRKCIICERYWYYLFYNAEARYVPYNMFLAGGYADGGTDGWRTIKQIVPRHGVLEHAFGVAFGNRKMTFRGQTAIRTSEYDVRGKAKSNGTHGFVSLSLSVHPQ